MFIRWVETKLIQINMSQKIELIVSESWEGGFVDDAQGVLQETLSLVGKFDKVINIQHIRNIDNSQCYFIYVDRGFYFRNIEEH